MAGVFPSEATVYIVAADVNGSALTVADKVVGEVTNFSLSGGEQDIEVVHTIGGDIEKELPRSQMEVSFDVVVQNTASSTLDRWDTYKFGTTGASTGEAPNKAIFLTFATGSNYKTYAFNNCRAVTWEPELSADDMLRGSINFKFSAETSLGAANLKTSALQSSNSFFNW